MRKLFFLSLLVGLSFSACTPDWLFDNEITLPDYIEPVESFDDAKGALRLSLNFSDAPEVDSLGFVLPGTQGGFVYSLTSDRVYTRLGASSLIHEYDGGVKGATLPKIEYDPDTHEMLVTFLNAPFRFIPQNQWVWVGCGDSVDKLHPINSREQLRAYFLPGSKVLYFKVTDRILRKAEQYGYFVVSYGHTE